MILAQFYQHTHSTIKHDVYEYRFLLVYRAVFVHHDMYPIWGVSLQRRNDEL